MIKVFLTANLKKYYPTASFEAKASSIKKLIQDMDQTKPGFAHYILEDDGSIRRHVNIFVNHKVIEKNQTHLFLKEGDEVHIMQALSGG